MNSIKNSTKEAIEDDQTWELDPILKEIEKFYLKSQFKPYWSSEKDQVSRALELIAAQTPYRKYIPDKVIGIGGSGIVLSLSDPSITGRSLALKFPRPVPGKISLLGEMLSKEISYLAQLRHPGIVRILHHDIINETAGQTALPFYFMEYVEGQASKNFINNDKTSQEQFISLISDTAQVINYLHNKFEHGIAHLDIKPDNIIIDSNNRPIIIDLGTCKRIQEDESGTIVACTLNYAHPKLAGYLLKDPSDGNRAQGEINRDKIDPFWDVWAFALTILEWMGYNSENGELVERAIMNKLSAYSRKYLLLLVARILVQDKDRIPNWLPEEIGLSIDYLNQIKINSSNQLCDIIDRLTGATNPLDQVEELNEGSLKTIQVAEGAHVPLTSPLIKVLNHRLFRRLNSVTQLGFVSQVFPSAKQTRREHSLGTFYNVIRMLRVLYNDPVSPLFRHLITPTDCRVILLLSLLHDTGQFPFAHELEDIDNIFNHNEFTQAVLRGAWDKKSKGYSKAKFESLKDVYKIWGVTQAKMLEILNAAPKDLKANPLSKLLRSFLSGAIDADKLDYLFRDARHLDLPYPNGIDVDRLFRCLTTIVISKIEGGAKDVTSIGVHSKGKVAAEFLSIARYAMFSQGYWHHAVRVQSSMLGRAILALLSNTKQVDLGKFISSFVKMAFSLPESLYERIPKQASWLDTQKLDPTLNLSGTDLSSTDAAVLQWLMQQLMMKKLPEADLIKDILNRRWYKRLWVVSHTLDPDRWEKIVDIWKKLDRDKKHKAHYEFEKKLKEILKDSLLDVTTMSSDVVKERLKQYVASNQPWILIDIPRERSGSEIGLHYVVESQRRQLRKDNKAVGELNSSNVWEQYSGNLLQMAGKIRVFCEPTLVENIEASIKWELAIDELITTLESLQPI